MLSNQKQNLLDVTCHSTILKEIDLVVKMIPVSSIGIEKQAEDKILKLSKTRLIRVYYEDRFISVT